MLRIVCLANALARQAFAALQAALVVQPMLTAAKVIIIVYKLGAPLSRANRAIKALAAPAIAAPIVLQVIAHLLTNAASDKVLQDVLLALIAVRQLINV
jgi:hypothetical protein